MQAYFIAVVYGSRREWIEEVPDPKKCFCITHMCKNFDLEDFIENEPDENGEMTYIRKYVCEDCSDEEFWNNHADEDDPFLLIDMTTYEDESLLFYRENGNGKYYLKPSPEQVLKLEREVLLEAGQMPLF